MRCDVLLALAMVLAQRPDPAPSRPALSLTPPAPAVKAPDPAPATPPAEPAPAERLTAFDADHADLQWSFQGWQLTADGVTKDFGRNETDARQALRLIRELRLNERGVIGGTTPTAEYWLADGRAPQGPAPGMRPLPIDSRSLRVEQAQGQWVLRDDRRVLLGFAQEGDARQALAVAHKYGFTQVGTVGRGAPTMIVFFAQPDAPSADAAPRPAAPKVADPASPAAALLAQHPDLAGMFAVPAVPSLRGTGPASPYTNPDRTPFDSRQVQVREEAGGWKLAAGGLALADFGTDQQAARQGLAAVQHYGFTEQCRVGGAAGPFTYYLCGGRAPRGAPFGVDGQSFKPDLLEARQVGNHWVVCEGDRTVAEAGDTAEAAKQVLDVIRRQHFDRVCHVGPADGKGLTFYVQSR